MSRLSQKTFEFPDPNKTLDDGLLCVGGNLEVATLYEAYSKGIFPWPQEDFPLLWFSPPQRGVLEFEELHISRSLKKEMRKQKYDVRVNESFAEVIEACSVQQRPDQDGTWILPEMILAYLRFHRAGHSHSVEVWQDEILVGGLYGVFVNGVFSAESMFYHRSNMSKIALLETIEILKSVGVTWMDIQMVTPHLQAFGGKYISRIEFQQRLGHFNGENPFIKI